MFFLLFYALVIKPSTKECSDAGFFRFFSVLFFLIFLLFYKPSYYLQQKSGHMFVATSDMYTNVISGICCLCVCCNNTTFCIG